MEAWPRRGHLHVDPFLCPRLFEYTLTRGALVAVQLVDKLIACYRRGVASRPTRVQVARMPLHSSRMRRGQLIVLFLMFASWVSEPIALRALGIAGETLRGRRGCWWLPRSTDEGCPHRALHALAFYDGGHTANASWSRLPCTSLAAPGVLVCSEYLSCH